MVRLKVKSVHHIVRSIHTQFQENAEEPVQLSILHSMVATRFPRSNISVIATSCPVTDVFPNVRVKRVGKKVLLPSLAQLCSWNLQWNETGEQLLSWKLTCKKRVPAESEVQSTAQYQQLLCSEVDSAVCSRQMLLHGPDTVERFAEFSMSAVITELQASCPPLYQLVQQLGCTPRNARDGLSTRRRAERSHGSLYSSECTVCKGEGTAVNDQSDAGRKGNRQTGIYMYIHVKYAHMYTNHSKEYNYAHIYTLYIYFMLQAMTLLNHAGVCMSYTATWDHLLCRHCAGLSNECYIGFYIGYTGMA